MSNRESKLAALRKLEQRTTERSKAHQLFSCALRALGAAIEAAAIRRGLSAAVIAEEARVEVSRVLVVFAGSAEACAHDYIWVGEMVGLRVGFELDAKHARLDAAIPPTPKDGAR